MVEAEDWRLAVVWGPLVEYLCQPGHKFGKEANRVQIRAPNRIKLLGEPPPMDNLVIP